MAEFTTEYLPLASLAGDPRNPRTHSLTTIEDSIDRFGIVDRITRDDRTGYLISGHGRTRALRELYARGSEPPAGVRVAVDGTWLVPVNVGWASQDDTEAAAALIAMNRTGELGGWVDDSLLELLDELGDSDDGFTGVGFTDTDLEDLRARLEEEGPLLDDGAGDDDAGGSSSARAVSVKITDPGLIDTWHGIRDTHKTDDAAVSALFAAANLDAARGDATRKKRGRRTRAADPTLDDLG